MTYYINSNQARSTARNDLTIFSEVNYLMEQVITTSQAGGYTVTVTDGTEMTESTPTIVITGTVANPTVTGGNTFIVAGSTITLGTTGTNLNSVIADINDAGISGVVASKNASNNLVITYTAPAASSWVVTVGSGTANTELGFSDDTEHTATNPTSVDFFQAWQGNVDDPARRDQMNEVKKYFDNLGYTIERLTNTSTGRTFKWQISW
jgi:hypothetical protein